MTSILGRASAEDEDPLRVAVVLVVLAERSVLNDAAWSGIERRE